MNGYRLETQEIKSVADDSSSYAGPLNGSNCYKSVVENV